MKKRINLRAAKQLENIGNYSAAIVMLNEFIALNPDYNSIAEIELKIANLSKKKDKHGDTKYRFTLKPLLTIPLGIIKFTALEIVEYVVGLAILAAIFATIYYIA